MKKILVSIITFVLICSNLTGFASSVPADFTGESLFRAPIEDMTTPKKVNKDTVTCTGTIPPLKLLRLKLRERAATKEMRAEARAKQKAVKKALKLKKKNKNTNVVETLPSGDIERLERAGIEDVNSPERVVITCDDMDYNTEESVLNARGNVVVKFVEEDATIKTDYLVYDKRTNIIKALGNVVISRKGADVFGESIIIDLNKENAVMAKPLAKSAKVSITAENGYVYQDKVVQENGRINVNASLPVALESHGKSPKLKRMMLGEDASSFNDYTGGDNGYRIKVSQVVINSDKRIESLYLKNAQIYKGNKKLFKIRRLRLYTNKNHDFVDGTFPEIASRRHMGFFVGPGWAFKLPFGALLKVAPILAYKGGEFGVGGFSRFSTGTNTTEFGYATTRDKFVLRGEQILDDNLKIEYGAHDFMDNWFLGKRMPKYGVDLIYNKSYPFKDFLFKNFDMRYTHQASFGLFGDADRDKYYTELKGNENETFRARYMMEVNQKVWNYKNEDSLLAANISIVGQASSAYYGTGDTQFVARVGPRLHTQYKRWMQDLGYFQSGYHDHTPLPVFDAYRYGHSNLYLREYFRVSRLLTLSWLGSVTLTDDSYNGKLFQECAFFASLGPDDMKLNIGYDFVRSRAYVNVAVGLDAKGTVVDYKKLEIKNPDLFQSEDKHVFYVGNDGLDSSKSVSILQKAVVEDVVESDKKVTNEL